MSERSKAEAEQSKAIENQDTTLDAERLAATNARLLKESQEYKAKYKQALSEKEELESKKLVESGDIQAQLDAERKKAAQAMAELAKTKKKVIGHAVTEKIARYAGEVYSVDDLTNQPELKSFLKEGLDEDNLDFSDDAAKRFIEAVKKSKPYLWRSTNGIGAMTGRPQNGLNAQTVDTSKMNAAELKEYMKQNFK
jgi:hypothetical protein